MYTNSIWAVFSKRFWGPFLRQTAKLSSNRGGSWKGWIPHISDILSPASDISTGIYFIILDFSSLLCAYSFTIRSVQSTEKVLRSMQVNNAKPGQKLWTEQLQVKITIIIKIIYICSIILSLRLIWIKTKCIFENIIRIRYISSSINAIMHSEG